MRADWIIAGTIAVDGILRMILTLTSGPCDYNEVRFWVAIVYIVVATAGFLVVRWDIREQCKESGSR
jgi:general stress protein CsbA